MVWGAQASSQTRCSGMQSLENSRVTRLQTPPPAFAHTPPAPAKAKPATVPGQVLSNPPVSFVSQGRSNLDSTGKCPPPAHSQTNPGMSFATQSNQNPDLSCTHTPPASSQPRPVVSVVAQGNPDPDSTCTSTPLATSQPSRGLSSVAKFNALRPVYSRSVTVRAAQDKPDKDSSAAVAVAVATADSSRSQKHTQSSAGLPAGNSMASIYPESCRAVSVDNLVKNHALTDPNEAVPHGLNNESRDFLEQLKQDLLLSIRALTSTFDTRLASIEAALNGNTQASTSAIATVNDLSVDIKELTQKVVDDSGTNIVKQGMKQKFSALLDMLKQTQQDVSQLTEEFAFEKEFWRKAATLPKQSPKMSSLGSNVHSHPSTSSSFAGDQAKQQAHQATPASSDNEDIFDVLANFQARLPAQLQLVGSPGSSTADREEIGERLRQYRRQERHAKGAGTHEFSMKLTDHVARASRLTD